jgi:hypothetical protein
MEVRPGLGGAGGGTGVLWGTRGVLAGYSGGTVGLLGVFRGSLGMPRGVHPRDTRGLRWGTHEVLTGTSRGTHGVVDEILRFAWAAVPVSVRGFRWGTHGVLTGYVLTGYSRGSRRDTLDVLGWDPTACVMCLHGRLCLRRCEGLFVSACLYICQWVCLRVRAFVRLCVCVRVNHCVSIGVLARVRVQCVCVWVRAELLCACTSALCRRCAGTPGPAGLIARPAARAAACAWLRFGATGRVRARSAAGVTWTSRTTSAPWAGRSQHTTVIDAAGAIYVIGGANGTNYVNDVWASTDGGARAGLSQGWWSGGLCWYLWGY